MHPFDERVGREQQRTVQRLQNGGIIAWADEDTTLRRNEPSDFVEQRDLASIAQSRRSTQTSP
jgi:hypothetical protein